MKTLLLTDEQLAMLTALVTAANETVSYMSLGEAYFHDENNALGPVEDDRRRALAGLGWSIEELNRC